MLLCPYNCIAVRWTYTFFVAGWAGVPLSKTMQQARHDQRCSCNLILLLLVLVDRDGMISYIYGFLFLFASPLVILYFCFLFVLVDRDGMISYMAFCSCLQVQICWCWNASLSLKCCISGAVGLWNSIRVVKFNYFESCSVTKFYGTMALVRIGTAVCNNGLWNIIVTLVWWQNATEHSHCPEWYYGVGI